MDLKLRQTNMEESVLYLYKEANIITLLLPLGNFAVLLDLYTRIQYNTTINTHQPESQRNLSLTHYKLRRNKLIEIFHSTARSTKTQLSAYQITTHTSVHMQREKKN